jgi:hypothetical protein
MKDENGEWIGNTDFVGRDIPLEKHFGRSGSLCCFPRRGFLGRVIFCRYLVGCISTD